MKKFGLGLLRKPRPGSTTLETVSNPNEPRSTDGSDEDRAERTQVHSSSNGAELQESSHRSSYLSRIPFLKKLRRKRTKSCGSGEVETRQGASKIINGNAGADACHLSNRDLHVSSETAATSDNDKKGLDSGVSSQSPVYEYASLEPAKDLIQDGKKKPEENLIEELFRLCEYGWYWGPISRGEAEYQLQNLSDGSFLVRDSTDDCYLLALTFRSAGKILHTRIEQVNGMFSFYVNCSEDRFPSIIALIENSLETSQNGVFCYSQLREGDSPHFPVRFTHPVSRFAEVRSLQYLCRFAIRRQQLHGFMWKLPHMTRI